MGYYNIQLYPRSKHIFTIVIPWGKYEYQKLPVEFCNIPDTFQENIDELFEGLNMVCAFIDNVLVITKYDFADHLKVLENIPHKIA